MGLALAAVACGGERPASDPVLFRTTAADPVPVPILHMQRDTNPDGSVAKVDVHVLLPVDVDQPTARATLQHMIDSIAGADSVVAAIRVQGFMMGRVDAASGEADAVPAIVGLWGPLDTAGFRTRTPRTRFRTVFNLLRPIPDRMPREGQSP